MSSLVLARSASSSSRCSRRGGRRPGERALGFAKALKQDLHGTHVRVKLATFGEADTGYWAAHPSSRQHVPWISRTGLIPTLSSEWAGERIVLQVCVGGGTRRRACRHVR